MAVFLLAVLWTVIRTKEYSPEELKSFAEEERKAIDAHEDSPDPVNKYLRRGLLWTLVGLVFAWPVLSI